ncbi:MAG: CapA family protein, partial [Pyrinomonadaceae bacterium]
MKKSLLILTLLLTLSTGCSSTVDANAKNNAPVPEPTPKNQDPITIAAVGDIMMASTYPNESRMPPNDGADLFKDSTPILSAADIAFGNLEGPIVDSGVSGKCSPGSTRCFAFRTPTRYAKYLKAAGFDLMSVANNHAGDFGLPGRESTQKVLDEQGIKYAGSLDPPATIAYMDVKGKKVALIGFGHNRGMPNVSDLDGATQLVNEANKKADIIIVSF